MRTTTPGRASLCCGTTTGDTSTCAQRCGGCCAALCCAVGAGVHAQKAWHALRQALPTGRVTRGQHALLRLTICGACYHLRTHPPNHTDPPTHPRCAAACHNDCCLLPPLPRCPRGTSTQTLRRGSGRRRRRARQRQQRLLLRSWPGRRQQQRRHVRSGGRTSALGWVSAATTRCLGDRPLH